MSKEKLLKLLLRTRKKKLLTQIRLQAWIESLVREKARERLLT